MRDADADPRPCLRVVIFREANLWLAQALEHDVGVQAERLAELLARLADSVRAEMETAKITDLPPAPAYFQALWPARAGVLEPEPPMSFEGMPGLRVILALVA